MGLLFRVGFLTGAVAAALLLGLGGVQGCQSRALGVAGAPARQWESDGPADACAAVPAGPPLPLAIRWQASVGHAPVGAPLLAADAVLVATARGEIVALERRSGRRVGVRRFARPLLGEPTLWRGWVIVARAEPAAALEVLVRATGVVAWQRRGVFAAPVGAVDDVVLAAAADGVLAALDIGTGAQRWSTELGSRLWIGAAAAGGIAYLGTAAGELVAVSVADGTTRWRTPLRRGSVRTRPLLAGAIVCAGTASGAVVAVDADDGRLRWCAELGALPAAGLACTGGTIVAGAADRRLHGLDVQDGVERWTCATDGVIAGAPAASAAAVYCGSADGHLYVVDPASGRVLERHPLDAPARGSLAAADDAVFIVSERGTAYAFAAR